MLETLRKLALPFAVPQPRKSADSRGQVYFSETEVRGRSVQYQRLSTRRQGRLRFRALQALSALHSRQAVWGPPDTRVLQDEFLGPLSALAPYAPLRLAQNMQRLATELPDRLTRVPFLTGLRHGDFKIGNLLWSRAGRVTGVVDWDMAARQGLASVDALLYVAFDVAVRRGIGIARAIGELNLGSSGPRVLFAGYDESTAFDGTPGLCLALAAILRIGDTARIGAPDRSVMKRWSAAELFPYLSTLCREILQRFQNSRLALGAGGS